MKKLLITLMFSFAFFIPLAEGKTDTPVNNNHKIVITKAQKKLLGASQNKGSATLFSHQRVSESAHESFHPATGTFTLDNTDIRLPGNGGLTLAYGHYYNSGEEGMSTINSTIPMSECSSTENCVLMSSGWQVGPEVPVINEGFGWRYQAKYDRKGKRLPDDQFHLSVRFPNGNIESLIPISTRKGERNYVTGSNWRAMTDASFHQLWLTSPAGITYYYLANYDSTNEVSQWVITWVKDLHGNSIEFGYDNYEGLNYLTQVVSSDGRRLDISLDTKTCYNNPNWRCVVVTPNSNRSKTWIYVFAMLNGSVDGNLVKVVRPGGRSWDYRYSGELLHSLQKPNGLTETFDYAMNRQSPHGFPATVYAIGKGKVVALSQKSLTGPGIQKKVWEYTYSLAGARTGLTDVKGPKKNTQYYYYITPSPLWNAGVVYKTEVYGANGLWQRETLTWDGRYFGSSHDAYCVTNYTGTPFCGNAFYAPVLLNREIYREGTGTYTSTFDNDDYGRPLQVVESGDDQTRTIDLTYFTNTNAHIIGGVSTKKVNGKLVSANHYDPIGDLLSNTTHGVATTFTYDPHGNLASRTDANGHTTRYEDYFRGQPKTVHYPDHSTQRQTINTSGTIATKTDANGHTTRYVYDGLNRVTSMTNPKKQTTTLQYKINQTIQTKNNLQITTTYDAFKRPIEVEQQDTATGRMKKQVMQYDADNHLIFKSYPFDNQTGNSTLGVYTDYDALGRVTQQRFPQKSGFHTTYQYQAGHQVVITDPKGNVTTKTYASYGNPNNTKLMDIQQPEAIHTRIERDALGYIQAAYQNNLARSYQYYPTYFLKSLTDPEVGTTTYTYDNVGNILTQQIGNQKTTFTYDPMNRLLTAKYSDGSPTLKKTYYLNGTLKAVDKGNLHEIYQYDANDNLTDETFSINDKDFQVHYDYDGLDHLAAMLYPDKQAVNFTPDAFGSPRQVNDWATHIQSYPSGIIQSMQLANGINTQTTLNDQLLPETLQFIGKSLDVERTYHYDPNNNMTSITDKKNPTYNLTLGYDGVNRLTEADGNWGKGTIHYTPNGDIRMMAFGKNTLNYSFNAYGSLDHVNNETLKYDAAGNVINNDRNQFVYGVDGNLTTVKDESGKTRESYQYDGNGQRLIERNNLTGETTYSLYNLGGTLLYDTNSTKGTSHDYIYLQGHKIIQLENTSANSLVTYFHNNLLGSPIAASDVNGKLLWEEHYQPYGERLDKTQGKDNLQWFTGKVEDANDGLMYYGARYYDPKIGRFMGADPKGFDENNPLTFNLYAYAADNPYLYTDPNGESFFGFLSRFFRQGISFTFRLGEGEVNLLEPEEVASDHAIKPSEIQPLSEEQLDEFNVIGNRITTDGPEEEATWPPNRGFEGDITKETLQPGAQIDRYGMDYGTLLSPRGTPFEMRSLPQSKINDPYNAYEVLRPIEGVSSGRVAPWFRQPGRGMQYELPNSVRWHVENGYLKPIK